MIGTKKQIIKAYYNTISCVYTYLSITGIKPIFRTKYLLDKTIYTLESDHGTFVNVL